MLARPEGVTDADVSDALAAGWGFEAETVEYAAVGFGSYHWIAVAADGARRFVTVDDVGNGRLPALRQAFDTALALRNAGLEFVVAPLPMLEGASVGRLDERYSIALLPFVDGEAGAFGEFIEREGRAGVLDLLIELHTSTGVVRDAAPNVAIEFPGREHIIAALGDLGRAWGGGPFAEPARAWLTEHAGDVAELLDAFDGLVARVAGSHGAAVITHGEPHPGNVVHSPNGLMLVDWDTVGLSIPERDLWLVADDDDERERYAEATGHRPDATSIELYALRWQLFDIAIFLELLRAPHEANADTEESWLGLDHALESALGR